MLFWEANRMAALTLDPERLPKGQMETQLSLVKWHFIRYLCCSLKYREKKLPDDDKIWNSSAIFGKLVLIKLFFFLLYKNKFMECLLYIVSSG